LAQTKDLLLEKGYKIGNIDATICAERPKINPHIPKMQQIMAKILDIEDDDLSIKATTSEKMGFVGREEGFSAYAVALIEKIK
jgi:2-C-methyl-D-erythritol 2,4-cyclodiphosphate synthase